MGILKIGVGTPLVGLELIDDHHLRKLRVLSITTVEELLGLIVADVDVIPFFLEIHDLAQLQADAVPHTSNAIMGEQNQLRDQRFALGARPPSEIAPEDRAEVATFDDYFRTFDPGYLAGDPGTGKNLKDCFGPIKDQGQRKTCVAFAGCAVLECLNHLREAKHIDHSEQFLYWNAKRNDGSPDQEGTYLEVVMPLMVMDGVCLESVWPYNPNPIPNDESQGPPPDNARSDARNHRAQSQQRLDHRSSEKIRQVMDDGRPVAISVPVYNNWHNNPNTRTTGIISMPLPNSILVGGHAMCAVGYDYDDEFSGGGYFILRNSWGTGWAPLSPIQPGYGVIPFAYIDKYGWEAFTCR